MTTDQRTETEWLSSSDDRLAVIEFLATIGDLDLLDVERWLASSVLDESQRIAQAGRAFRVFHDIDTLRAVTAAGRGGEGR